MNERRTSNIKWIFGTKHVKPFKRKLKEIVCLIEHLKDDKN